MHFLKLSLYENAAIQQLQKLILCSAVELQCSQLSVIYASTKKTDKEDALKLARLVKIYEKECLFSAAEIARLKNTAEFAYRQTSLIDVCAYRARIEQLPKFTLCSVVQF